jgi:cation diffusion facilitator CzcD-associated flavoprotein CzcO
MPELDLSGKRVAVVGTGASAVQIVPQISRHAKSVYVHQRTAPWILPRHDVTYKAASVAWLRRLPPIASVHRAYFYLRAELRIVAFTRLKWMMRVAEQRSRRHLRRQVPDEALRRRLTPAYRMGCKNLLLSNDYYPALTRENVELITKPIQKCTPTEVILDDGTALPTDVIVLATGFHVVDSLDVVRVTGRGGLTLTQTWTDGPQAYLGMYVAGFPNLFLLLGPNSGLAHNAVTFMVEAQARHIARAIRTLSPTRPSIEVDEGRLHSYNDALQQALATGVWSVGGCDSWYLDHNRTNRIVWPRSTRAFRRLTRRPIAGAYAGGAHRVDPDGPIEAVADGLGSARHERAETEHGAVSYPGCKPSPTPPV